MKSGNWDILGICDEAIEDLKTKRRTVRQLARQAINARRKAYALNEEIDRQDNDKNRAAHLAQEAKVDELLIRLRQACGLSDLSANGCPGLSAEEIDNVPQLTDLPMVDAFELSDGSWC